MPDGTGLDAARKILTRDPECRHLLLLLFDDDAYIRSFGSRVKGYLIKQISFRLFVPSIKAAYNGQAGVWR